MADHVADLVLEERLHLQVDVLENVGAELAFHAPHEAEHILDHGHHLPRPATQSLVANDGNDQDNDHRMCHRTCTSADFSWAEKLYRVACACRATVS